MKKKQLIILIILLIGCITPLYSQDTDGDGIVNTVDLDDDNDGIPDIEEDQIAGKRCYSDNLIQNSDFSDASDTAVPIGQEWATGWTSGIKYSGVNVQSVDHEISKQIGTQSYGTEFKPGERIIEQSPFPGDPEFGEAASGFWLWSNGNPTTEPYIIAQTDVTGIQVGLQYAFVIYVSNALNVESDANRYINPKIQFFINGSPIGPEREIYHESDPVNGDGGVDTWHRIEYIWTAPEGIGSSAVFSIKDTAIGAFGDDFAFTSISFIELTSCDFDQDGIPNHLDLDSDNDGIYDVIEAGGIDPDENGIVGTGNITDLNNDGLNDATASTPLPFEDLDGDLYQNTMDLDSDADNCFDVREYRVADQDNDGIALHSTTLTVHTTTGLVNNVTYGNPFNTSWLNKNLIFACKDCIIQNPHIIKKLNP